MQWSDNDWVKSETPPRSKCLRFFSQMAENEVRLSRRLSSPIDLLEKQNNKNNNISRNWKMDVGKLMSECLFKSMWLFEWGTEKGDSFKYKKPVDLIIKSY